ncbi:MAG: membrane protein insertase YidC [Candidatus Omnitrophica bacterium]|jgi:YidC/Oxa1 family membrane protein insertase|nr:membrane protein insertase YidC [Candidatus Omnitrophota bacterium]
MEKQLVKTLIITFLFVMGYMFVMQKYFPKQTQPTQPVQEADSAKTTQTQIDIVEGSEKLPEATMGNFVVTYSLSGGYVKKIFAKPYNEELPFKNIGLALDDINRKFTAKIKDDRIIFTSADGATKEFIFEGYLLKIKSSLPAASGLILFSNSLQGKNLEQPYQEVFYVQKESFRKINLAKIRETTMSDVEFSGVTGRYFCASLLKGSYSVKWLKEKENFYFILLSPSAEVSLYLGPQTKKTLQPFGLQGIVHYGFFHGIGVGLAWLLNSLYVVTKSWGLSIILLAVIVYLIFFPFTSKSTKAMKQTQAMQPRIAELNKKYKGNLQKINKEERELLQEYNKKMMGGCLPMLFQMPIFLALWQVLPKLTELKGASFLWIKDLSLADHAFKLPFPPPVDYINLLPIGMMITGVIQQKFMTPPSVSGEQKSMGSAGLVMSLMFGVILYNFASCLTLYWLVQNILTLTYQMRVAKARFHVKTPQVS